jgi:hypothetical protein
MAIRTKRLAEGRRSSVIDGASKDMDDPGAACRGICTMANDPRIVPVRVSAAGRNLDTDFERGKALRVPGFFSRSLDC